MFGFWANGWANVKNLRLVLCICSVHCLLPWPVSSLLCPAALCPPNCSKKCHFCGCRCGSLIDRSPNPSHSVATVTASSVLLISIQAPSTFAKVWVVSPAKLAQKIENPHWARPKFSLESSGWYGQCYSTVMCFCSLLVGLQVVALISYERVLAISSSDFLKVFKATWENFQSSSVLRLWSTAYMLTCCQLVFIFAESYYTSHLGMFTCNYVIRCHSHCAETKRGLSNFLLLHHY